MAGPLTWREVSAPNFSGVSESQRLAASLLERSTSGLSAALGDFQDGRQKSRDQDYLAGIGQFTDSASLGASLRDGGASGVSTEALKYGMERQRHLLGNETIGEANNQQIWNNDKTQAYEAGRPAAVARINEIRSLSTLGTPEAKAKAQELMAQSSDIFSASGMSGEDVMNMINGNTNTANIGLASNQAFQATGDANQQRDKQIVAKDEFAKLMQSAAGPEDAARKIRARTDLDPDVMGMMLGAVESQGATLFGGPVDPGRAILDQQIQEGRGAQRISYANQGAKRNQPLSPDLESAISPVLESLGITMKVVSGGQVTKEEQVQGKGDRVGSERHDGGHSGDVDFYAADGHKLDPKNPADIPILTAIVQQGRARGITGWGEGEDYMGSGRVHLGFGSEAAWGAGGKSANAPEWLKNAISGTPLGAQPTAQQSASQQATSAIDRALAVSAQNPSSADNQSLMDAGSFLGEQSQTLIDQGITDDIYNQTAPLLATLTTRPDQTKSKTEVIQGLHDSLGEDANLDIGDLTGQLNKVSAKFNISPDISAAIMKNAMTQTTWGLRWLKGEVVLDEGQMDNYFRKFIDPNAETESGKLQPTVEQFRQLRAKRDGTAKIEQMKSQVASAQQEYMNAAERKKTRPEVDVEGPLLRYQALLSNMQETVSKLDGSKMFTANINGVTGR